MKNKFLGSIVVKTIAQISQHNPRAKLILTPLLIVLFSIIIVLFFTKVKRAIHKFLFIFVIINIKIIYELHPPPTTRIFKNSSK